MNPPVRQWDGKRVWLIGASTGIGRALAHALDHAGAQVIISARQQTGIDSFVKTHPRSQGIQLDVTMPETVRHAAQQVLATGPIDVVCYCAGYYREQRAMQWNTFELLRHLEVNFIGAVHALEPIVPAMLRQGYGHISIVSSVAGWRGLPKSLGYGPSKAALINLAETLYLDLRPQGLGVSLINPGFVDTPLTAQNDFHMPALIGPDLAARKIIEGWEQGQFDIHFPKRFTLWLRLLRVLPYSWYFFAVRRFTKL